MDNRPSSMLSFIQTILSRQQSQSNPLSASSSSASSTNPSTTGRKRKRSLASNAPNISTTPIFVEQPTISATPLTSAEQSDAEMTDREQAIAQFLALPDGPLIKRARRGDEQRGNNGRLSVIRETEEDGQHGYRQGVSMSAGVEGEHVGEGVSKETDRDVEMEDVELMNIEGDLERGLWTYHGGNSMLR